MKTKHVKDVMLPLEQYAVVNHNATILEAIMALDNSQYKLPPGMQPHRAVLVRNDRERVVGKLGYLGFLKALEPKYSNLGDLNAISRAGLSQQFLTSMMEDLRFWEDDLTNISERARTVKIKDVMLPVKDNIDENATLNEAIHKMIICQTLSLPVKRGQRIVGILRLSDLFNEISEGIREMQVE